MFRFTCILRGTKVSQGLGLVAKHFSDDVFRSQSPDRLFSLFAVVPPPRAHKKCVLCIIIIITEAERSEVVTMQTHVTLRKSHNSNLQCQNDVKIYVTIVHDLKMCCIVFGNDPTTHVFPRIFLIKMATNLYVYMYTHTLKLGGISKL